MALLQKFRDSFLSNSDRSACIIPRTLESDFEILKRCVKGLYVDDQIRDAVNRLASVGLVRFGSKVVIDEDNRTIKTFETVKATRLGIEISKTR